MLKASQNNTVAAFAIFIFLLAVGYNRYGTNETTTTEVPAQEAFGLAGETAWLESQKAELEQLMKDTDQISRAIPEQLAQIQAETLNDNLTALRAKEQAAFNAAVMLQSLGEPEYDALFRDMSSTERLDMSGKLLRVSTDLGIEADKTEAELTAVRAKIPASGPTSLPELHMTDIAATQQDLQRMFEELGVEQPKN